MSYALGQGTGPLKGVRVVGALEPQFYDELVRRLGIADRAPDRKRLLEARLRELLSETFASHPDRVGELFGDSDACCAPVLPTTEAAEHPHLEARGVYVEHEGLLQPAPAPRFSRTEPSLTT